MCEPSSAAKEWNRCSVYSKLSKGLEPNGLLSATGEPTKFALDIVIVRRRQICCRQPKFEPVFRSGRVTIRLKREKSTLADGRQFASDRSDGPYRTGLYFVAFKCRWARGMAHGTWQGCISATSWFSSVLIGRSVCVTCVLYSMINNKKQNYERLLVVEFILISSTYACQIL